MIASQGVGVSGQMLCYDIDGNLITRLAISVTLVTMLFAIRSVCVSATLHGLTNTTTKPPMVST